MRNSPPPPPEEWAGHGAALLVLRHREPASPDPDRSILNLAEASRDEDWSLRSALVRLAQPEPVRVGALLEVIRRTEGALAPLARTLERHTVAGQPSLGPTSLIHDPSGWRLLDEGGRRADPRAVDLARLAGPDDERLALLATAYSRADPLEPEELQALGPLQVALELDRLADVLARWAATGPADPPLDAVDDAITTLAAHLDRLGVPRETRPAGPAGAPGGGPSRRRRSE